ncbi:MAG: hypothetical protein GTN78_21925, partial [Gemmatimonadales bacterium]|nr:hypothetical protein [Gemmatimonadales bacterium]
WSDPHFVAVAAAFITFAAWQVVDHFLLMEAAVLPMMTYHLVSWIGETAAAAAIALIVLRALVRKNTQLTELNRLKDLLTDALVHDLRQPLTALLSGLLATERDPDIPEKSKYLIALSRQGGEELLGMVNDLLDVSRLEAGEPVISAETISPGEFVGAGAEAMRQFAQESGIELTLRVPGTLPPVQGDRG